jgi:predicted DNA-binding protein (UPF0251 family)
MMGTLQASLGSMTTATAVDLVRATPRRSELTRSISQARKPQAYGGRLASPAARKEWDLVQQAIAGNADAQEQLFKTHTPRLFRTAFAVLRNKEDAEDAVQDSWNPEHACLAIEVKALIEEQIRELPPGMRGAFRLCEVEGFSAAETLEALGIHKSALKSRISRARQKLTRALEQSILRPARTQAAVRG